MLEAISLGWFALVGVRARLRHRELLWVFQYEVCAFDLYLAGCVHEGNLLSFSTSESRCGQGGHAGVEIGGLHPCNPLAQHQGKAGQSSELKTQEESAPKETEMQSCCRSWDVRSPHREISFHLVKTFHSDYYQSISFCLAFSLAVMGHPGYLSRKFLKETSFRASLCDKNISTLSKRLIPSYILKQNLPRCALWICTKLTVPMAHPSTARPGEEARYLLPSAVLLLLFHLPLAEANATFLYVPMSPAREKSPSFPSEVTEPFQVPLG